MPRSLPAPWPSQDIGALGFPGSADFSDGTFVINGSGADIWHLSDAFHFASQPLTGNGQIIARLDSMDPTSWWSKAGLMFREDMSTNARMAMMIINGAGDGNGDQHQFIWRENPGWGTPILIHTNPGYAPRLPLQRWLKLTRQGNTFTGYYSTNGTIWNLVGSSTVNMASTAYVGLAVTAENNTRVCGAVFDNVTVTPAMPTTTTLTPSLNPSPTGTNVVFTAEVTTVPPGAGTPANAVRFRTIGAVAALVNLNASAQAAYATSGLPHGSNIVTAEYISDGNFLASTVSVVQVVNTPRWRSPSSSGRCRVGRPRCGSSAARTWPTRTAIP